MEEITKELSMNEKIDLVLAELTDVKSELADLKIWRTKVDAFIDDRSRDTQPLLGKIHKEIADTRFEIREKFEQVDERFNKVDERFNKTDEKLEAVSQDAKKAVRFVRTQNDVLLDVRHDWKEHDERIIDLERQMEKQQAA